MRKKSTKKRTTPTERLEAVVVSEEEEAAAEASDPKLKVADVEVDNNTTEMITTKTLQMMMTKDTPTQSQSINKLLEEEIRRRI